MAVQVRTSLDGARPAVVAELWLPPCPFPCICGDEILDSHSLCLAHAETEQKFLIVPRLNSR